MIKIGLVADQKILGSGEEIVQINNSYVVRYILLENGTT